MAELKIMSSPKDEPGFWVILENAEGAILRAWFVASNEGIPFGARLRVSIVEPPSARQTEA